ncbi:hypothetical protein DTO212C5_2553 [Paecilomyces variotii]|nr:hypothetical protein DTO212C5_2553 [Paecilomyces variotii]
MDEKEHEQHVSEVLERFCKHNLYAKLSKCEFHKEEVSFLGFIVGRDGIKMDPSRIITIRDWPTPKTFYNVQVFLGFASFFRRFIYDYSSIMILLTDLLKGSKHSKKTGPLEWTPEAQKAFEDLKTAFIEPLVLRHYDPEKPIIVATDALGFALAAILLQLASEATGQWYPVAYFSRKFTEIERRYEVHDQELLAIVEAFKHWRHYLDGSKHPARIQTDHANLRYFFTTKTLNSRQARWAELLAGYDFYIKYKPGRLNAADTLSRRLDYKLSEKEQEIGLLPTLQKKLKLHALNKENSTGGREHLLPRLLVLKVTDREMI